MKTDISPRPAPDMDQFSFNDGTYSLAALEDDFVAFLRETSPIHEKIKVVSHLDYKVDTDTAHPLIVCAAGAVQPDHSQFGRISTNYGPNSYPGGTDRNDLQYGCVVGGPLAVRCVARSSRETLRVINEVFSHLLMFSPFIPEMLGLRSFRVQSVSQPTKISEENKGEHMWVAEINTAYTAAIHWSLERNAPRLKTSGGAVT